MTIKIIIALIILLVISIGGFYLLPPQPPANPELIIVKPVINKTHEVIEVTENKGDKTKAQESLQILKNSIENIIADSVQEEIQTAIESKINSESTQ